MRFSANYGYKSPGFDSNDLGFQRRADERTMNHWLQWRDQTPGKYVREYMVNINQWAGWNFGGDRLFGGGNLNMHWTFQNNWRTGFGFNANGGGVRDRSTRGGPVVMTNDSLSLWHYIDLDDRRVVTPGYNGYYERDGQGTFRMNANPRLTWRPSRAIRLETGVRFNRNDDDAQWVENVDESGATHYVFGRLEQRTVAMTLRANYTMSPDAVVPELRRAIRVGRTLSALPGTDERPGRSTTTTALSPTPTPTTPTSTTDRSARPTCCAGSTGRGRRCSPCGSRDARRMATVATSASAATSAACSRRRPATCSW